MRVVRATMRIHLVELVRLPSFTLPLALLPSMLYLAIGLPSDRDATSTLLGFVAFALLGTMMFHFGVGIASSRDLPWSVYTTTLPSSAAQRAIALLAAGAVLGIGFCVPIVAIGVAAGVPPPASPAQALAVTAALVGGAVVHGLLGIALGCWLPARGAVGITNVLYFPLSFAGGLLGPVAEPAIAAIGPWTPTGAWVAAMEAAREMRIDVPSSGVLLGSAACFVVVAIAGYRRVERTTYR